MESETQQTLDRIAQLYPEPIREPIRTSAVEARAALGEAPALGPAEILADLRLGPPALAAAILAPAVEAEALELSVVQERLGDEVAGLVEGVVRLRAIHWARLEHEAAEALRKMFLAMAQDVRVVLIALALHLQQVRSHERTSVDERLRLANESIQIFAPLANRLGVWSIKSELEDLAFAQLQPETYTELRNLLAENVAQRSELVEGVVTTLREQLAQNGITGTISGRVKHIYSIFKKMRRKDVGFEEIYDVSAVRVQVEQVSDCYAVLGIVHGLWAPIAGEFDDYIAKPKDNFYQSLHTAVIGPRGRSIEIQIRTREMHEFAERGIAAHWRYKEGRKHDRRFDEKVAWLRQLIEWQKSVADPQEFAESLKTDVFQDQVYVFTPNGDIIDLPVGATAIDFAYRIHTQVGHRCRGARIDSRMVPLDRPLQTGERIEIVTAKSGGPSRDWLNPHLGYVRSSAARQKIRGWFREQEREASIAQGRDLVERELKRIGMENKSVDDLRELFGRHSNDDFLAALGFGDINPQQVGSRLLAAEERTKGPDLPEDLGPHPSASASLSIAGIDDVMSHAARCCNPVPGDAVVGFITRGRGIAIHRRDCPNLRNHPEPERLMQLDWSPKLGKTYPIGIRLVANDRSGLLRDIAEVITTEGVNMSSASVATNKRERTATISATLEVRSIDQIMRILSKLDRLPYVLSARRSGR